MFFIDSNIFMYAAGAQHENKIHAVQFLHRIARREIEGCINTEILQEILHRYRFIHRWNAGKEVYLLTKRIISVVIPVDISILDSAYDLLDQYHNIYARDAIHAATCMHHLLDGIISYDTDFDSIENITRLEPQNV